MKPTMLPAFSFIHFALITIAIFPSGAVVAQQPVLDIYGDLVRTDSEYYIYEPRGHSSPDGFRVIGLSATDDRVVLYDCETDGIPVNISQISRSTVAVDTGLTITFNNVSNSRAPPFLKVALEPDSEGNHFVKIGGSKDYYAFKLAQDESGASHHLYYLTYTISPFGSTQTLYIDLLGSFLVAKAEKQPFQFTFVPVELTAGTTTPPLSS